MIRLEKLKARFRKAKALKIVLRIIIVILVPIVLTLNTVKEGAIKTNSSENILYTWKVTVQEGTTPNGYTCSLLLFIVPIMGIGWWFLTHPAYKIQRKAFCWSLTVLMPLGFILDILFANSFFTFTNTYSTLGIYIPVVGGAVPIEEFIFYITGFIVVLLTYLWSSEYWFELYNLSNYVNEAKLVPKLIEFNFRAIILGIVLILVAVIYKKFFSPIPKGFPWYFTYLVIASIIPTSAFLSSTYRFINWRAFSFTFFVITLISLIWEATLAAPYGWWGYHDKHMMGIFIKGWWNLPIEAALVWLMVTFTTVIIYEVIKIRINCGKKTIEAFWGTKTFNTVELN